MIDSQEPTLRQTRLRDFGAFQADVSTLRTREVAAVYQYQHRVKLPENARASSVPSEARNATPSPAQRGAIIQFPRYPSFQENREPAFIQQQVAVSKPPSSKKKWINVAVRFAFTVALFVLLFKSLSWSTLFATLAHIHRSILLIGLSIGSLGVVVSSYQWRYLLQSEKIRFDLADLINLYLVGTAFSHFLPTGMGGDAVKAFYVGRESGKNDGSASAVIMSRVTGFFGMVLIAALVLVIQFRHFSMSVVIWFLLLSLLVGAMILGAILSVTLLPKLVRGKWAHNRVFLSITRIGKALSAAARKPRTLSIATLYGVVFWIIACLNYYTYATALGLHLPLYFYFVAIPLVSLIAFLPISINGFGVRESAFVYIFSTVHVLPATSLLLALLIDAQVLFFGAVGGCVYLTINRKKNEVKTYRAA